MKIKMNQPLTVACTDGIVRNCVPGDVVSVYHLNGRRLLYRRLADWICIEPLDPIWDPPAHLKMAVPRHDKMARGAMNKGAA
jgi:hypothetical protein